PWVKTGKARNEHKISDSPPESGHSTLCAFMSTCSSEWERRIANGEILSTPHSLFAIRARTVLAVLAVVADMLDGHHMLVLGGVEHDDALGRAAADAEATDRTADQLALVGHQHDLVRILDRE